MPYKFLGNNFKIWREIYYSWSLEHSCQVSSKFVKKPWSFRVFVSSHKFGQVSLSSLLCLNQSISALHIIFIVMNVFDINKSVTSELISRSGPLWNMVDR